MRFLFLGFLRRTSWEESPIDGGMNVSTTGIYATEDVICQHLLTCFLKTLLPQQNACVRTFPENQHDWLEHPQ